ncbi:hypothetical protein V8C34DRAFT_303226 [Trichoderma compactum]
MASDLPNVTSSSQKEFCEPTPYASSSLTEDIANNNANGGKKCALPSQDANTFREPKSQTLGNNDPESGQLPALGATVSRATTISKKRAYTFIWYVTVFLANLRNWDPVLLECSLLPMAVSGTGAAFLQHGLYANYQQKWWSVSTLWVRW